MLIVLLITYSNNNYINSIINYIIVINNYVNSIINYIIVINNYVNSIINYIIVINNYVNSIINYIIVINNYVNSIINYVIVIVTETIVTQKQYEILYIKIINAFTPQLGLGNKSYGHNF